MDLMSGFIGAILGAIVAGYCSIKATQIANKHQREQSLENEKKLLAGLLQSIHDEIETVYERYQETMGARLESLSENNPLVWYYPLVSDFFTIYNSNGFLIGKIPSNDLRKQIIKTCTLSKGMVDSYRMNNDLVGKFEYAHKLFEETGLQVHQNQTNAHFAALVEYAKTLKESHKILKIEVASLLRELRKNGVLNELKN
ncbi:hypothetical protein EIK76_07545 [Rheinheimera mesophila]|uniref:Uncharacterized protein n=1 Tax=Rheinheimera mesophila TaxID=1547515 RepID=A0A3P3QS74_9GAMM|nr:hypothetical protein [Rheinheimera mesophila]KKL01051.1 hypothetical protein SD53_11970 [Rheinheimera mesophila]RRJ23895.1 hypothetical protein EIK76_07545 [Rheinheimera mesophila]